MSDYKITLPPCPFCGGPPVPIVVKSPHLGGGVFKWDNFPPDGIYANAYVFCHECGATGPEVEDIVCSSENCIEMERKAMSLWVNRDLRHNHLYEAELAGYPRDGA